MTVHFIIHKLVSIGIYYLWNTFCLWDHCRKLKLYNYLETLVLQETNNSFYLFFCLLKNSRVLAQVFFFSEIVYRINFLSFSAYTMRRSERKAMMPFYSMCIRSLGFSKHLMERWLERERNPASGFTSLLPPGTARTQFGVSTATAGFCGTPLASWVIVRSAKTFVDWDV